MTAPVPPYPPAAELARTAWPEVPKRPLVLVPVGSTEQHGPHLPLSTDTVIATQVARRAADRLGPHVLPAPAIAYGASGEHAGFPGTVSVGHEALRFLLVETVRSLSLWAGRTVFVNGHGGNVPTLDAAVAQLRAEGHEVAWVGCDTPGGDAHAGRTETSLMLHFAPDDVRLTAAAPGNACPLAELMPELRAQGVRAVSPNGVLGDPTGADAEEGRAWAEDMVTAVVHRITAWRPDPRGRLLVPASQHPTSV
ncbi:mycofactocin biosynthesis peptidyl-dipeptidase MftE [Streptomyces gilvus]|uniref:mycofactocin biosynthesis peptidyl-dipeptidase MftE n=1 Tax=Streptomyces gilvus TaxID=2920937 RepID=UPI001F103CD8|nr:mycofactocin biosynthesis peptidyl-dipeptidase MftE [Streptomyces sp. CME 23]MCH5676601.1 mycofactocin biosynthesis peptidyl-dipeptidase MftE [Streptomyces sp. CME 23]